MTNTAFESASAPPAPSAEDIINATLALFEKRGYQQGTTRLSLTREDLSSGRDMFTTIRPYNIYRDVCAALCFEMEDADSEAISAMLPGEPCAKAAGERAIRQINIGQQDYIWIEKQLRKALTPVIAAPVVENKTNNATNTKNNSTPGRQPTKPAPRNNVPPPPPVGDETPTPPVDRTQPLTIDVIKRACVMAWNEEFPKDRVSKASIDSEARSWYIVRPRQLSMYLSKCLIDNKERGSYPSIGRQHGNRDHTTALHSFRKVAQFIKNKDESILTLIQKVSERLQCTEKEMATILHPEAPDSAESKRPSVTKSHLAP